MDLDEIYSADQIKVHLELAYTLKEFTKSVIIEDPDDILELSYLYFKKKVFNDESLSRESDEFLSSIPKISKTKDSNIMLKVSLHYRLKLRREKSMDSEVIGELNPGEIYKFAYVEGNWAKLASDEYFKISQSSNFKPHDSNKDGWCVLKNPKDDKDIILHYVEDNITNPAGMASFAETHKEQFDNLNSKHTIVQIEATAYFRKLLSINDPPIQDIIDCGVAERIIQFLDLNDNPRLQIEASWVVTNIASGNSEQTEYVVNQGVIPILIKLLMSENEELRDQSAWALANIAGDCTEQRDVVLRLGGLSTLLSSCDKYKCKDKGLENITYLISNFCNKERQPHPIEGFLEYRPLLLQFLSKHLSSNDEEILSNICYSLSFMTDTSDQDLQNVIDSVTVVTFKRIMELMNHSSKKVQKNALRIIGNIVSGNESQTQMIVDLDPFPALLELAQSFSSSIQKEAGNSNQIQKLIDANVIETLIKLFDSFDEATKKETTFVFSNISGNGPGSDDQIKYMIDQNVIPVICKSLASGDMSFVEVAITGLKDILKIGYKTSSIIKTVIETGGLNILIGLKDSGSWSLSSIASSLIENYFEDSLVDEKMIEYPDTVLLEAQHVHPLIKLPKVYEGDYNCNVCGKSGRNWVYHCDECQYDAHPLCAVKNEEDSDPEDNQQKNISKNEQYCVFADSEVNKSLNLNSDVVCTLSIGDIVDIVKGKTITKDNETYFRGKLTNGQGWVTISTNNGKGKSSLLRYNPFLSNTVSVKSHNHELSLLSDKQPWNCNGRHFEKGCKSSIPGTDSYTINWQRYRCDSCNYDLCEWCVVSDLLNKMVKKYRVVDNGGANIRETIDLMSEIVKVVPKGNIIDVIEEETYSFNDYEYIRGKLNDGSGWATIIIMNNNTRIVLPYYPIPENIEVINHSHNLKLNDDTRSWNCDGRYLKGSCLSGEYCLDTNKLLRYRCCESCDFDYCEWCAYIYAKQPFKLLKSQKY